MPTSLETFVTKTKTRAFVAALVAGTLIAGTIAATLFLLFGKRGATWNPLYSVVPAQVQVTVDRRGASYAEMERAVVASAERLGYRRPTGPVRGASGGDAILLTDTTQSVLVQTGYSWTYIDPEFTMFSVVDWTNGNRAVDVAKAISDDISASFPAKRIYIQLDSKQYDCERTRCSFEAPFPIKPETLPRWLGPD